MNIEKLIQIMPAQPGWRATFTGENPSEPLVAWGLTEKGSVVGLAKSVENRIGNVENFPNFKGYASPA